VPDNSKTRDGKARTLLIEIGTEELPPKTLQFLSGTFLECIASGLETACMLGDVNGPRHSFASPRRIAAKIEQVYSVQPDQNRLRKGPAVSAAFGDNGSPTSAAEGFARSCGVSVSDLDTQKTGKGEWLVYAQTIPGKTLESIIPEILDDAIRQLPIPKRMRWGDCEHEFVRPLHWLLALHGDAVMDFELMGLNAGRITHGHRFHAPGNLLIGDADRYADELREAGHVIADYASRKSAIQEQVNQLAEQNDLKVLIDSDLLDEVAGLTEWPVALEGSFDERFLKLPREVLIETMASHQKYFSMVDQEGRIASRFIVVANLQSQDPQRVRKGNERVLGARLADAEFFWDKDQKIPLMDQFERLKTVVFHNKLGSILDKSHRIVGLARKISEYLNLDEEAVEMASRLCKTDLVTEMVGEFPKLQGVVGRYYAHAQGIDPDVAEAIESHYLPRFSGDRLPSAGTASSVAIADRIDTLCGIFACGDVPSGESDPFGLRRASLGVLRILAENQIDLDLEDVTDWSMKLYREQGWADIDTGQAVRQNVIQYVLGRSRQLMLSKGYDAGLWNAVMGGVPTRPLDLVNRIESIQKLVNEEREVAESIIAINKRISNMLKNESGEPASPTEIDLSLIQHKSELELANTLVDMESAVLEDRQHGNYANGYRSLFRICGHIDQFFDNVLVKAENPRVRHNRIKLLQSIRSMFLEVVDFSQIRIRKS